MRQYLTNHRNIVYAIIAFVCLVLSFSGFILSNASALFPNVDTSVYFEYQYTDPNSNTYKFKCYKATLATDEDDENPTPCAAISWFEANGNNYPGSTLYIPETVNDGTDDYTVKIISKAGFRRCTSQEIILPSSIVIIQEEAFSYCMNMKKFSLPHQVTEICSAAFMDCRSLETFYYTDSTGQKTLGNDSITKIGDHAFDSCVKLKNFYCPSSVVEFGESCFQNCVTFSSFYFPNRILDGNNNIINKITVRKHAFADCVNLTTVYMDENIQVLEERIFAKVNRGCVINYTGTSEPGTNNDGRIVDSSWRRNQFNTNDGGNLTLKIKQPRLNMVNAYPGLIYTIETNPIYLDWAKQKGGSITIDAISNNEPYIAISNFVVPIDDVPGYWTVSSAELIIPDEIVIPSYNNNAPLKVKVISSGAFAENTTIKIVRFNKQLVQICRRAFFHCNNIGTLDFSQCENLIEISYEIFNSSKANNNNVSTSNAKVTKIDLPPCLQYIADYAFYNFTNLTQGIFFGANSQLKTIGEYAFALETSSGYNANQGKFELVLPKTLDDATGKNTYLYHPSNTSKTYIYGGAVQRYAFANSWTIKSVVMEKIPENSAYSSLEASLGSYAFYSCKGLTTFRSNSNLLYIGNRCFRDTGCLREAFLCSTKAESSSISSYPWGLDEYSSGTTKYDDCIFSGSTPNYSLVIYVNGSRAPKNNDISPASGKAKWNGETGSSFVNDFYFQFGEVSGNVNYYSRSHIPTYYNIDWMEDIPEDIIYWRVASNAGTFKHPTRVTESDYTSDNGLISLVRTSKNPDKYTVANYYLKNGGTVPNDQIDLTTLPTSIYSSHMVENEIQNYTKTNVTITIEKIGNSAFASNDTSRVANNLGKYYILPNTITTIEDRAFYRRATSNSVEVGTNYGVRVVTYKNGGNIVIPTGLEKSTYTEFKSGNYADSGYCSLPSSVIRIENDAFYNNRFKIINIESDLSYLAAGAFAVYTSTKSVVNSISIAGNNSNGFSIGTDGGLYYTASGYGKLLTYIPGNKTLANNKLVLDNDVVSIGMFACANTNYSEIALPSTLKQIYGNAFKNNVSLTKISGSISNLEYISALPLDSSGAYSSALESFLSDSHYDNTDYKDLIGDNIILNNTRNGAFEGCANLASFDFTQMTSIKSIGPASFRNCSSLINLTNAQNPATYNFYTYSESSGLESKESKTSGVLDLSACTNLRHIDFYSFVGCSSIEYAILPNSKNGNLSSESSMKVGWYNNEYNPSASTYTGRVFTGNNSVEVLVSESVYQADRDLDNVYNSSAHYALDWNEGNITYYYAESLSDVFVSVNALQKYWTKDNSGNFILFSSYTDAKHYFENVNV